MTARSLLVQELLQGMVATGRGLADLATIATQEEAALLPLIDDLARLIAYRAAVAADLLRGGQPSADASAELLPSDVCAALKSMVQEGGAA